MKSKRTVILTISILVAASLTGCANMQTVERTTQVGDKTAIHLDAQQRLVLFTKKKKEDGSYEYKNIVPNLVPMLYHPTSHRSVSVSRSQPKTKHP